MITKLVLHNWRSHEDSEFGFGKGTNVLVGAMGSGKSTAMDAVSFALFGTFPNLQQRRLKLDDVIMNRPAQKDDASVVLNFIVDGKEYSVKRVIKRGKGTTLSEVRQEDLLLEGPNSQRTTEKICDILKLDYDLFSRAVYAEQNNIEYFLEIPKGQRRQKIDDLLRISKFELARKNLTTVINRMKDMADDKAKFAEDTKEIDEIPDLESEIKKKEIEKEAQETRMKGEEEERKGLSAQYEEISGKKKRYAELDEKIKENKGRIELLNDKLEQFAKVDKTEPEIKEKLEKLSKTRKEVKELEEKKEALEREKEKIGGLINRTKKNIEELSMKLGKIKISPDIEKIEEKVKKQIEDLSNQIQEMSAKYKSGKVKIDETRADIKRLHDSENCPTCDASLTHEKRDEIIKQKKTKLDKILGEIKDFELKISDLNHDKEGLEKRIEEITEELRRFEERKWLLDSKGENEHELEQNNEKLKGVLKNIEEIKIEKPIDEIDKEIKAYEKHLEYFKMNNQLAETKNLIKGLKQELERLDYDEKQEKETYEKLKEAEKMIALYAQEMKSISELVLEKMKRLDELKKIKEDVERNRQETEYIRKSIESFQVLQNVLQNAQMGLRQQFTETTNIALTDVWKRIYPYGDYLDLKLGIDEAGDYILQLKTRAEDWINVEGVSSGGERSTACLALRIALSLVLAQNLSWLVLDEPTHNLDRRAIQELATTLRDHLPEIVDQVFIITHEPELEKAASGYLYRLERNKEQDEPTRVVSESMV